MKITKNKLKSLVGDMVELILERTNIDEIQEEELFDKIMKLLKEYFNC